MDTEKNYSIEQILSVEQVRKVHDYLSSISYDAYWRRRDDLGAVRGINGAQCAYDFIGYPSMPPDMKEYLKSLAPRPSGYFLSDMAVNRYKPGDFIGSHKDRAHYRMNTVIALHESGDGIYFDDEDLFIEDKPGQGITLYGTGPVHSVPPVKTLRHVLIYLYE